MTITAVISIVIVCCHCVLSQILSAVTGTVTITDVTVTGIGTVIVFPVTVFAISGTVTVCCNCLLPLI